LHRLENQGGNPLKMSENRRTDGGPQMANDTMFAVSHLSTRQPSLAYTRNFLISSELSTLPALLTCPSTTRAGVVITPNFRMS
jgi:hypothetical protein